MMPYKDKAMKSQRQKERRMKPQSEAPTPEAPVEAPTFFRNGVEYVPASYIPGTKGRMYQFLPERPRYLTLSDNQVLDRLNQPTVDQELPLHNRMLRANDSMFAPFRKRKAVPLELKDKLVKL